MKCCKRCVLPDTKPGLNIDDNGICSACSMVEIKKTINWEERQQNLKNLCGTQKIEHETTNKT